MCKRFRLFYIGICFSCAFCLISCAKKPYVVSWQTHKIDGYISGPKGSTSTSMPQTYAGEDKNYLVWGTLTGHVVVVEEDGLVPKYRIDVDSPIEATGTVYKSEYFVGLISHAVVAVDIKDGEVLWRFETDAPVLGKVLATEDTLYVVDEDQIVYAIDRFRGELRWRFHDDKKVKKEYLGQAALVLSDGGGALWFASASGRAFALNKASGESIFSVLLSSKLAYAGLEATPVALKKEAIFLGAKGPLAALSQTGAQLWQRNDIQGLALTKQGDEIYVGSSGGKVMRVQPESGETVKVFDTLVTDPILSVLVDSENLVAATARGWVCVFDKNTTTLKWRYRIGKFFTGDLVSYKDGFLAINRKKQMFYFKRQNL